MRARAVAQLFHKVQYSIVQYSFVEYLQLKRVLEVAIGVFLWTKLELRVYFLHDFDTVFELVLQFNHSKVVSQFSFQYNNEKSDFQK